MNRYIVDSVSNGTIVYFIIRDTSNNSIVPLPTKYLKYKKNLGRKKKTLKNIALKLTWYLNYLKVMKSFAKTIRFYDTHKDQVAIKAISNFAEYGFNSANEMVVTALYELAERHNNHSSNELPLDGTSRQNRS